MTVQVATTDEMKSLGDGLLELVTTIPLRAVESFVAADYLEEKGNMGKTALLASIKEEHVPEVLCKVWRVSKFGRHKSGRELDSDPVIIHTLGAQRAVLYLAHVCQLMDLGRLHSINEAIGGCVAYVLPSDVNAACGAVTWRFNDDKQLIGAYSIWRGVSRYRAHVFSIYPIETP